MADKKLLTAVEDRSAAIAPLLRRYRWTTWGQPVDARYRPALCLVADALHEPLSTAGTLLEMLEELSEE